MMKGYSAEEAREAARRSRRPGEAASRPPLAATAYATTRDKVCFTKLQSQLSVLIHNVQRCIIHYLWIHYLWYLVLKFFRMFSYEKKLCIYLLNTSRLEIVNLAEQ